MHESVTFPWLSLMHGLVQTVSLALLLVICIRTMLLPVKLDTRYDVYHNLRESTARMLLPSRATIYPSLDNDTTFAAGAVMEQVSKLPTCGGFFDGATAHTPPTEMPAWMLPADESGLDKMLHDIVSSPFLMTFKVCTWIAGYEN
jgi:hypothetical protein